MLKSILVVAGTYVLSIVLVVATDPLLSLLFPGDFARGRIPSNAALLSSTAAFAIVSVICAWLCARFSPGSPGRHVFWFFVLGEVMGTVAIIPTWSKGWPHWYWLSWLFAWPLCCYIGLQLAARRPAHLPRAAS